MIQSMVSLKMFPSVSDGARVPRAELHLHFFYFNLRRIYWSVFKHIFIAIMITLDFFVEVFELLFEFTGDCA